MRSYLKSFWQSETASIVYFPWQNVKYEKKMLYFRNEYTENFVYIYIYIYKNFFSVSFFFRFYIFSLKLHGSHAAWVWLIFG